MNKTELIDYVAESADLSKAAAGRSLDAVITAITEQLTAGNEVALVGFATFTVGHRAARQGRNPQTGAVMQIPAARVPKAKFGKHIKDLVNEAA